MMPMYNVGVIVDLVSDLCQKFDFFVYNILFENVAPFRKELILKSYEKMRELYKVKFPMEYTSLNYIAKDKVNDIFKYLYERKDLEAYCHDQNLFFPVPRFIKSLGTGEVYSVVDLLNDKYFVFPPKCDLVFYKQDEHVKIVYFDELMSVIEKYCHDLPGFIHNTKVLTKAGVRKLKKIMNKTNFTPVTEAFSNVELETIIDFR
jgi:hypothetical protein